MQKNLTTGSVFRNIIFFSLPYLLSYFLQTLYGMADLFIIGQFEGVASTTAVSVGSQVMHMLTVMIVGLAMGSTVSIGQAVGGNRQREAAVCVGNTVTMFMGLSLVLTAVLLAASGHIVAWKRSKNEYTFHLGRKLGMESKSGTVDRQNSRKAHEICQKRKENIIHNTFCIFLTKIFKNFKFY